MRISHCRTRTTVVGDDDDRAHARLSLKVMAFTALSLNPPLRFGFETEPCSTLSSLLTLTQFILDVVRCIPLYIPYNSPLITIHTNTSHTCSPCGPCLLERFCSVGGSYMTILEGHRKAPFLFRKSRAQLRLGSTRHADFSRLAKT